MGQKMVFPSNVATVVVDGHEYTPDSEGVVETVTGSHVAHLRLVGAVDHNPVSGVRPLAPEEKASVLSDENEMLKARIRELEATTRSPAPLSGATDGTGAPLGPSDGQTPPPVISGASSGAADTSSPGADRLKAALAAAPNPEDPNVTRDQMVQWLGSVNVAVPGNISRDKAAEIVKDTVAGKTEEAEKLAGEARAASDASN